MNILCNGFLTVVDGNLNLKQEKEEKKRKQKKNYKKKIRKWERRRQAVAEMNGGYGLELHGEH